MMTSAQFVETSVTVTNNSPFQDYPHPDDHTTRLLANFILVVVKDLTKVSTDLEQNTFVLFLLLLFFVNLYLAFAEFKTTKVSVD